MAHDIETMMAGTDRVVEMGLDLESLMIMGLGYSLHFVGMTNSAYSEIVGWMAYYSSFDLQLMRTGYQMRCFL
jgi:hypothetical protein